MTIAILSNDHTWTYNLRKEVIKAILDEGHRVILILSYGEKIDKLVEMGCEFIDIPFERRGTNPVKEIKLCAAYWRILKKIKPDVVLSYTIKPNIYGGIVAKRLKIPYIANITGLGTAVENKGPLRIMLKVLYKYAFTKIHCIFVQNEAIKKFFEENNIAKDKLKLIPGSGVNLETHTVKEYPPENEKTAFLFVGRLMKAKGIEELLYAAEKICDKYKDVAFWICGAFEEEKYVEQIKMLSGKYDIKYFGRVDDVDAYYAKARCVVLPSYHEGTANVLLEGQANGRPVISTRVPGCIETFEENKSGFACEAGSKESLLEAIEKFMQLPYVQQKEMGIAGRCKVERSYDRKFVINAYIKEIQKIVEE